MDSALQVQQSLGFQGFSLVRDFKESGARRQRIAVFSKSNAIIQIGDHVGGGAIREKNEWSINPTFNSGALVQAVSSRTRQMHQRSRSSLKVVGID